jgi:glycosyltransferase involved in cell wall biosynthesis
VPDISRVTATVPTLSVVIPAHNAGATIGPALQALESSSVRPCEIIVVDDASSDRSLERLTNPDIKIIRTGVRSGPARARNVGAREASGDILFFLDADVCVHRDTLGRVEESFTDASLDALIGSYDDEPESGDFLSQYRNLMHCFVHQTSRSEASTFWSGCGAIRKATFDNYSGFDETYRRPAIEDIELGYRLIRDGRRIILDRDVQVKHLKRWSFWGLVKTDIINRGIPWTELILRDRHMPNDLNLQLSQRVSVALVYLMLGVATLCAIYWGGYFLTPFFAFLFFMLSRYWTETAGAGARSAPIWMAIAGVIISWLAWRHHMLGLIPLVPLSFASLYMRHRYDWGEGQRKNWNRLGFVGHLLLIALTAYYLPRDPLLIVVVGALIVVLVLNKQFYLFLAAKRGWLFAAAAVPFHLLYHLYNGLSFFFGLCRWGWMTTFSRRKPLHSTSADGQR